MTKSSALELSKLRHCSEGLSNYYDHMVYTYNGPAPDGLPTRSAAMLDLCAKHGLVADIEMIRAERIDQTHERTLHGQREIPLRDRHRIPGSAIAVALVAATPQPPILRGRLARDHAPWRLQRVRRFAQ